MSSPDEQPRGEGPELMEDPACSLPATSRRRGIAASMEVDISYWWSVCMFA